MLLTPRVRVHSSQTVEMPAPRTEPCGGSGTSPSSAAVTVSRTSAMRSVSGGQPGTE